MRIRFALLLLLSSCLTQEPPPPLSTPEPEPKPIPDPTDALYNPDRLLEVAITIDSADWEVLRFQPRRVRNSTCDHPTAERRYDWFPAEITIDGETISNVGVRKKGNLGSLSVDRPSLKVKFSEFVEGQRFKGIKNLTLNNSRQDSSYVRQCLGYRMFADAGVAASRCSFARVSINGVEMGIYVNVEPIKKPFLARHFTDKTGSLYEGGGSDLRPNYLYAFQPKENRENPDCSDLDPLGTAMDVDDDQLIPSLESVIDLDNFMSYWATEVIVGHWDGYVNNTNNYYIYNDPGTNRFRFIPWGVDEVFDPTVDRSKTDRPESIYACAILGWRLYMHPEGRARYVQRMRELLDSAFDQQAILQEIDRMEALITPVADPDGTKNLAAEINQVRSFVEARRRTLLAELDSEVEWPEPLRDPPCFGHVGHVSGTFRTTWGTVESSDPFAAGSGTLDGTLRNDPIGTIAVGSTSGLDSEHRGNIQLIAGLTDGTFVVVSVIIDDPTTVAPGTLSINFGQALGIVWQYDPATERGETVGLLFGGNIRFDRAGISEGAPIVGALDVDIVDIR